MLDIAHTNKLNTMQRITLCVVLLALGCALPVLSSSPDLFGLTAPFVFWGGNGGAAQPQMEVNYQVGSMMPCIVHAKILFSMCMLYDNFFLDKILFCNHLGDRHGSAAEGPYSRPGCR